MANREPLLLGVDGGGSSTRVAIADARGRICGYGTAGGANPNRVGMPEAIASLRLAVEGALRDAEAAAGAVTSAVFGVAGMGDELGMTEAKGLLEESGLLPNAKVRVDHDLRIALMGGLRGGSGVVLVAGTGSACFGLDASGRGALCGGWGLPLDDVGSAAWLGLKALQEVARQSDGRAQASPLAARALEALGASGLEAYSRAAYKKGLNHAEIAGLAPLVVEAAFAGDFLAMELIEEAISGLAELASVVVRKLDLSSPKIVLVGGLARSGAPFQPVLEQRLRKRVEGCRCVEPALPPVAGAVIEAARMEGVSVDEAFLENLGRAK